MGIFGWSYPPGVSRVPGDEPEPPCPLCGKVVDGPKDPYTCPECPECGVCGCIEHLSIANLCSRLEVAEYVADSLRQEYRRRCEAKAVNCPGCSKRLVPDLQEGNPMWCDHCKRAVDNDGKWLQDDFSDT